MSINREILEDFFPRPAADLMASGAVTGNVLKDCACATTGLSAPWALTFLNAG
jgi:hypothetical protein